MQRAELAHILRAAARISGDSDIVVIGSQSILGSYSDHILPKEATRTIEADLAFRSDPDEAKADLVDVMIGEQSEFHRAFGVYGQGVSVSTATLPDGWQDSAVAFADRAAHPAQAVCLDLHDLVVSKLVAGLEKDFEFAESLLRVRLVRAAVRGTERATLLAGPLRERVKASSKRLAAGTGGEVLPGEVYGVPPRSRSRRSRLRAAAAPKGMRPRSPAVTSRDRGEPHARRSRPARGSIATHRNDHLSPAADRAACRAGHPSTETII